MRSQDQQYWKCWISGLTPHILTQTLHFNNILRCFLYMLKFEQHCFKTETALFILCPKEKKKGHHWLHSYPASGAGFLTAVFLIVTLWDWHCHLPWPVRKWSWREVNCPAQDQLGIVQLRLKLKIFCPFWSTSKPYRPTSFHCWRRWQRWGKK